MYLIFYSYKMIFWNKVSTSCRGVGERRSKQNNAVREGPEVRAVVLLEDLIPVCLEPGSKGAGGAG